MRLTTLFYQLSKWELNHFEDFLKSPFFNKRNDVIKLFYWLKERQKKQVDRQEAFLAVHPNKEYNQEAAYFLFSYLYKLLEDFLAFQQIKKDKTLLKFHSAQAYRERKMGKPFVKKIKEYRTLLSKNKLRNSEYLRQLYDLEKEYYNYSSPRIQRSENNLEEVSNALDLYYIAEKIRYHCFQISHQAVFEKEYETELITVVIDFVEKHPSYLDHPPIAIYYNYYKAISAESGKEHFKKFRQQIESHSSYFTFTEIKDIYLAAINICIRRANEGGRDYVNELFELYKTGIEQGTLIENDELSPFTFKNILSAGIKLQQLNWLDGFIEQYQSKLNPMVREATVRYVTAALRYEQKKYEEAKSLLTDFDTDDYLLMLSAKTILLKIYYDLEDFEKLDAILESMRIYLQRKTKIGYHKAVYQNVIRLTKKLIALPPYDKKKKALLREKVIGMQPQSLRDWFLEKM